jgi:hypothetical protein
LRVVCAALGLEVREALIELGYVTRDELGLPPAPPPIDPLLIAVSRDLADEDVAEMDRAQLSDLVRQAHDFWRARLRKVPPREPSADERSTGKTVRR